MRAWPFALVALVLPGACSFDRSGIGGPDAFVDPGDDGGGTPRTWRDDTAADFAAGGAVLEDAVVEPWGAIGPAAWLTGALIARGADTQLFDTVDGDPWPLLEGADAVGWGITRVAPRDWGGDYPRGVGIGGGDSFTYWMDGEIWLDAGTTTFSLYADDLAIVDLAAPGDGFGRLLDASHPTTATAPYVAASSGWHRIRVAMAEWFGGAVLDLQVQGPGDAALAPVRADRLRAPVAGLGGVAWSAFDATRLLDPLDTFLFRDAAFDYAPGNGDVTGLGLAEADRFSMRWAGQVRIDVAGDYTFRLDSDDGHRLWIDGALVLDGWGDDPLEQTSAPVTLDVGWHDLVVDLNENTGTQRLRLDVVTGPELEGSPLPAERMRPVVPRHERTASGEGGVAVIDDVASAEIPVTIDAAGDALAVEVGVEINHSAWQDLSIVLRAPGGAEHVLLAEGAETGGGRRAPRYTVATPGEAAGGAWTLVVTDHVANDTGDVDASLLTVRHRGGEPPIATLAVYESPVEDLGAVVGFDAISWTGRVPAGAGVAVRLRTCDTIDGCASYPWSEPVTVSGERPSVAGRRFAQYRVELTSDGDATPYVDAIEIAYRGD